MQREASEANSSLGFAKQRERSWWSNFWFQLLLLIVVTLAAYSPTLRNGFIWDDDRYIEHNPQLVGTGGLARIWFSPLTAEPQYYPLTHTSFWVEYQLWGAHPLGYHLGNLLLHIASALLVWRLLRRLSVPGAWAAAMIFAVHPLQVETVAWATERKNVLSGFFYLLSLWAYLHTRWGRELWETAKKNSVGVRWYAASLILFVAALLSKSVACTLPAVILLLRWWKRGRIRWRDVWPVAPMLVMGAAMGMLTAWMEKHVVGAIGPEFDFLTPLDRICIAGRAFWFYLGKLLWPAHLSFIYAHWQVDPLRRPMWFAFPLAAIGLLGALWLVRRRIGRGPAAAMLFFAGTLLPALGFTNVYPMRYSYVADHFQYLACIGPIVLICALLVSRWRVGAAGVLGLLVVCLGASTFVRAQAFRDRRALWEDTLAKNPNSRMVHSNYAAVLAASGNIEAAKAEYRTATRLGDDPTDLVGLGECFAKQGDFATAMELYQKAQAATPVSSEPVLQHILASRKFQIGTAWEGLANQSPAAAHEDLSKAEEAYRQAIALYPGYEDARKNLAVLLINENRPAEAMQQCQAILQYNPDSVGAHANLGTVYYMQDRPDLALEQFKAILELEPNNVEAMASAGALMGQMGNIDQGIALLQSALRIDPNNAMARTNLAALMNERANPQQ